MTCSKGFVCGQAPPAHGTVAEESDFWEHGRETNKHVDSHQLLRFSMQVALGKIALISPYPVTRNRRLPLDTSHEVAVPSALVDAVD